MKTTVLIEIALVTVISSIVLAVPTQPFSTWDQLIHRSSNIIIARCTQTPARFHVQQDGIVLEMKDGILHSDLDVVSVLKGATNLGPAQLSSRYWPRQSELYLIFSTHFEGFYHATESYRVIPLGMDFPTNALANQSLRDQIRTVLNYRLHELDQELQRDKRKSSDWRRVFKS